MSTRFVPAIAFLPIALAFGSLQVHAADAVEQVVVKSVAHFDFANDTIRSDDQASLLSEVGQLKDVTWQTVTATGYTDNVGRPVYNQRLSKRRAAAVKSYLVGKGIGASMVRTDGKAALDPVASNASDEGRAQNRRTEVEFHGIRTASR